MSNFLTQLFGLLSILEEKIPPVPKHPHLVRISPTWREGGELMEILLSIPGGHYPFVIEQEDLQRDPVDLADEIVRWTKKLQRRRMTEAKKKLEEEARAIIRKRELEQCEAAPAPEKAPEFATAPTQPPSPKSAPGAASGQESGLLDDEEVVEAQGTEAEISSDPLSNL